MPKYHAVYIADYFGTNVLIVADYFDHKIHKGFIVNGVKLWFSDSQDGHLFEISLVLNRRFVGYCDFGMNVRVYL